MSGYKIGDKITFSTSKYIKIKSRFKTKRNRQRVYDKGPIFTVTYTSNGDVDVYPAISDR